MRPRSRTIAILAVTLAAAMAAPATTLLEMSLDQLTEAAQLVARVRVLSSENRWENGEIWTFTRLEVSDALKGAAPREVVVRLLGGEVGHLASIVEGVPRFRPGEEAYLFLESTRTPEMTVTGWAQGAYRIVRDAEGRETVTQDASGTILFDAETGRFRHGGIRRMPVEEFRQQVAAAAERGRGRR
jgi:hypothetical protein